MTAGGWARPFRAMAALAVGVGLGGASTGPESQKVPLRLPFAVDRDGSVAEAWFDVREDALYAINLTYLYDEESPQGRERDRVWHLVGGSEKGAQAGQWQEPGAPIVLEVLLSLRPEKGVDTDVIRQNVAQPRLTSWGDGTLTSRLAAPRLAPGRYHLVVRNLQAAPTLRDVHARIGVARAYMGK